MLQKSRRALALAGVLIFGVLASLLEPQATFAQSANAQLEDAIRSGNVSAVRRALAAGADVNAKVTSEDHTYLGSTFLELSCSLDNIHAEVVKLLLDRAADVNARGSDGRTALMEAAKRDAAVVKLLLEHGADVNAKDGDGYTALMSAKDARVAELLLDHGADVNAKTNTGSGPHQISASKTALDLQFFGLDERADPEVVMVLLRHGAELHGRDDRLDGEVAAVIGMFARVQPPPAIPAEAHEHMTAGATFLRGAKSPQDFDAAIAEFQKAAQAAPWWGDAYYDLGVAKEAAGKFAAAKIDLQLYLDSDPGPADALTAREKIAEIDAKAKLAAEH